MLGGPTLGETCLLYGPSPANAHPPGLGLSCPQPVPEHQARWVRFLLSSLALDGCEAANQLHSKCSKCRVSNPSNRRISFDRNKLRFELSQSFPSAPNSRELARVRGRSPPDGLSTETWRGGDGEAVSELPRESDADGRWPRNACGHVRVCWLAAHWSLAPRRGIPRPPSRGPAAS